MYSVGNVSPARTTPFLNQVMVGFGYPDVKQVKVADSPSCTLVAVGGCVKVGRLGCGGAVNQEIRRVFKSSLAYTWLVTAISYESFKADAEVLIDAVLTVSVDTR